MRIIKRQDVFAVSVSLPFSLGCVGAAVGPLLAGLLSTHGWDQVFYMLMTADFLALLVSTAQTRHQRITVSVQWLVDSHICVICLLCFSAAVAEIGV